MRLIASLLAMFVSATDAAPAAEILQAEATQDGIAVILLRGEIVSGDAERFEQTVAGVDRAIVFLVSEGGLVAEALRIGNNIRARGFSTAVGSGDECFSACALIWAGGSERFMSVSAKIGAHAAYRSADGRPLTSGIANAEIGAYLARLGLSDAAVRFFTIAEPQSMLNLTPDLARIVGLDLQLMDDESPTLRESTTLSPPEGAAAYAAPFASYAVLSTVCEPYLQPDQAVLSEELISLGTIAFPMPGWDGALEAATDNILQLVEKHGLLMTCIDAEAAIRLGGRRTGLDGPSFACPPLATPTETALCKTPDLWPLDRAMSALYFHVRRLSDPVARKRILAEQRSWMQVRDACGGDPACLDQRYRMRLVDFRNVIIEP